MSLIYTESVSINGVQEIRPASRSGEITPSSLSLRKQARVQQQDEEQGESEISLRACVLARS